MSSTHLGSVLVLVALLLMATRCARGTFVLAARERDRLAHAAADLVTAELTTGHFDETLDADGQLIITGNGCDLTDLDVLAYAAVPGSPPGRTAHLDALAYDEKWSVAGPPPPARIEDIRWVIWWTCPYRYRWRLTVHGRGRPTLQYVARPAGSAAHTNGRITHLRNTAWPYTYTFAAAGPHRRPHQKQPTPVASDPTEVPHNPPTPTRDDLDLTAQHQR